MSQDVVSFVLRFVREAGDQQDARWRGTVKHVQGAAEQQFTQFSEALAFMQSQLSHSLEVASRSRDAAKAANPWLETAKLWGEFLPQVNELVLGGVKQMLETGTQRSEAPSEGQLEALTRELTRLSRAVEQLQADIGALKAEK
jgi:hypothetical protein